MTEKTETNSFTTSRAPRGADLHFLRLAPARPRGTILFLHGITESRRYFSGPLGTLADHYELYIPDLPGFGLSPKPATTYSMDLFRDAIRGFVMHHRLHERPIWVLGHSLGSLIALEYATLHPDHLRGLILLNLPRHFSQDEAHGIFWRGSPSYRRLLHEQSLRASLGQLRRSGLRMSLRYARRFPWAVLMDARKFTFLSLTSTLENCLLNYRVDPILARAPAMPTLLIHGERDQVAPLAHVAELPRTYPWMRLVAIPGSGHHVLHTHGQAVRHAIRGFLEEEGEKTDGDSSIRP
jgi:pimeloyl-ACP methyl ester carboxylesterase